MNLTLELLKKLNACQEAIDYIILKGLIGKDIIEVLKYLVNNNKLSWANWGIINLTTSEQCLKYSIYAAKNCINMVGNENKNENLKIILETAIEELKKFEHLELPKNASFNYIKNTAWSTFDVINFAIKRYEAGNYMVEMNRLSFINPNLAQYIMKTNLWDESMKNYIKYGITLLEENNDSDN